MDVQADLTAKKADLPASSKKRRDLEREQQTLESSLRALDDDAAGCRRDIDDRNARKAEMSNAYNQRCKQAFKLDPSIQYAVEWIEQHQMEFEAKVHYPPMISVNVPDPRYAWQVEATTNIGTRKTFICENQADYVKLMSLNKRNVVVDGKPIKVDLWLGTIQVSEESANPRRPCSRETVSVYWSYHD